MWVDHDVPPFGIGVPVTLFSFFQVRFEMSRKMSIKRSSRIYTHAKIQRLGEHFYDFGALSVWCRWRRSRFCSKCPKNWTLDTQRSPRWWTCLYHSNTQIPQGICIYFFLFPEKANRRLVWVYHRVWCYTIKFLLQYQFVNTDNVHECCTGI